MIGAAGSLPRMLPVSPPVIAEIVRSPADLRRAALRDGHNTTSRGGGAGCEVLAKDVASPGGGDKPPLMVEALERAADPGSR